MSRALSPLISTILIIGFVILVGTFIFGWATGYFQKYMAKTEFESKAALACAETALKIHRACTFSDKLIISIENIGNTDVEGFAARIETDSYADVIRNDTKIYRFTKPIIMIPNLDTAKLVNVKKIALYPKLIIDEKEVFCRDPIKSDVKNCFECFGMTTESFSLTSASEKATFGVYSKEDIKDLERESGLKFQTDLTLPEYSFVIVPEGENVEINSIKFKFTEDDQVTYIALYGEVFNITKATYSLVNENKNSEIVIVEISAGDLVSSFEARKKVPDNWKGDNVHLKISLKNCGSLSYATVFRFCYSDAAGKCM